MDLSAATESLLHMDDVGAEIVSGTPTTAAPVRSRFQTDAIAVRVLIDLTFTARREGAVAFVDSIAW